MAALEPSHVLIEYANLEKHLYSYVYSNVMNLMLKLPFLNCKIHVCAAYIECLYHNLKNIIENNFLLIQNFQL